MHHDDSWQEFDKNGERLESSRPARQGNPKPGADNNFVATVNIWLYRRTDSGIELLFQKRSPYVSGFPDTFDRSAGGHINFGESKVDAAVRELREEVGAVIETEDIDFVECHNSGFSNMFISVYVCDYTGRPENFHFDDNEVSEVKWVPLAEIDDFIAKYAKLPLQEDVESMSLLKKWFKSYGNN